MRAAKGIPAWRTAWSMPLILATGFAEGAGLFLAAVALFFAQSPIINVMAVVAALLAVLRAFVWRSYLLSLMIEGAPTRAIAVLDGYRPWLFFGGLALPLALMVIGWMLPAAATVLFAFAGLAIAAAGLCLKFVLVTRAGFNQGFALAHTPVRGSGRAGPAVKPGWSMT